MSVNKLNVDQFCSSQDSAAGAAQTLTIAAVVGRAHHVTEVSVGILSGEAAGQVNIEIQDGVTKRWKSVLDTAVNGNERILTFDPPLRMTKGNDAKVVVSAGGGAVVTIANAKGYTV